MEAGIRGFEDVLSWLTRFREVHPTAFEGDALATTFASAITVFLLVSRLGQLFASDEFKDLTRAMDSDRENLKRLTT